MYFYINIYFNTEMTFTQMLRNSNINPFNKRLFMVDPLH
jgi:hypothetical protein